MKKIQIKSGVHAIVSDVDFQFASSVNWYLDGRGYARSAKGSMHRLILKRMLSGDIPDGLVTDHINRNKLDNRRENLRLATESENRANSDKRIGRTGYRGVRKQKGRNRWQARIRKGKLEMSLGGYETPELAALAYNIKAKEIYGEYAYQNKII